MTYNDKSQNSENDMTKFSNHNQGFINQHRLTERKMTSLELAKQYLSEIRNQSFR